MGYPMSFTDAELMALIKAMKPPCGARTRSGAPCKNATIGQTGRCRMHGGKSLGGIASPRYKHGRYSKYLIARLAGAYLGRDA
jgi:hypothetical protein